MPIGGNGMHDPVNRVEPRIEPIRGVRKWTPAEAKEEFKFAIDHWGPKLDEAGRAEVAAHFAKRITPTSAA